MNARAQAENSTSNDRPLNASFLLTAALADVLKVPPLNTMGKPWMLDVDSAWTFAVNGTKQDHDLQPHNRESMHCTIKPYHMAVWYNGWLAALMTPFDGTFIAGEAGNEDAFIAALVARLEKEFGGRDKFPKHLQEIVDRISQSLET